MSACGSAESRGALASQRDDPAAQGSGAGERLCNGRADLCGRTYDKVVFAATHNAHAALEYGYSAIGNQLGGLAKQLTDGVRGFLLDVYHDRIGRRVFCHGFCGFASTRHLDGLLEVKRFLDRHPNEVLTFIYENHVSPSDLAADFEATGLAERAFTKRPGKPWPTLGEMIDAGTRIVVTTENGGPGPAWVHPVYELGFDTPYGPERVEDLRCEPNRGSAENDLFLVNHWVNDSYGLPSEDGARAVNRFRTIYGRASECAARTEHVPNFVAVDFYEHGDVFSAVQALNDDVARGTL